MARCSVLTLSQRKDRQTKKGLGLVASNNGKDKSLESWIWDAACSIRGAKDAPKYKDYILPLIFTKRLCDVFDDELNRIAAEVGSRRKAFQLARADHKLVRFYLPLVLDDPEQPVWSVIRKLSDRIGEGVTTHMRAIARENPLLQGIIDRVDFNATLEFWRSSVDRILASNDQPLLDGPGSVSHDDMKTIATERYEEFDNKRRQQEAIAVDAEDLKAIEDLEKNLKRKGGRA